MSIFSLNHGPNLFDLYNVVAQHGSILLLESSFNGVDRQVGVESVTIFVIPRFHNLRDWDDYWNKFDAHLDFGPCVKTLVKYVAVIPQRSARTSDCKCVLSGTCGSNIPCGLPGSELCCNEKFECVIPSECDRTFEEQFGYTNSCASSELIRCFYQKEDDGIFLNEQGKLVLSGGKPLTNPLDTGASLNTEFRDYLNRDGNIPLSMIISFGKSKCIFLECN
ncbi:unnamed protein product [Lepeophtheirus salmonis]|uniref:(salmon louse) hypothetical protein n=1 Tax=Lepeophtheirus salmonis TaxID=72036 RepID=A0A7R8CSD9_LEPSM|nr:unnamed protein product [Lepeophtheirus salmonis]CAF2913789.1 unnamed protein product [Lepeophtheirus salmonis]